MYAHGAKSILGVKRILNVVYWGVEMKKKKLHLCGGGFKGYVVKAKGISFFGFCGKEFRI